MQDTRRGQVRSEGVFEIRRSDEPGARNEVDCVSAGSTTQKPAEAGPCIYTFNGSTTNSSISLGIATHTMTI